MLGMLRTTPVSSKGIACLCAGLSRQEERDLKLPNTAVDRACNSILFVCQYTEQAAYRSGDITVCSYFRLQEDVFLFILKQVRTSC